MTTSAAASRVPLYFEENQGQTANEIRFVARAAGYTAFLTSDETVLHYQNGLPGEKDSRDAIIRMKLAGSRRSPAIRGGERLAGVVNYLIGNDSSKWHTRIPIYADVQYDKVYPGIDLVYRPAGKQLAFDFHVAPGADPAPIRMTYSGAFKMHLDSAGNLVLDTAAGPAKILKPVAYQEIDKQRVPVAANYVVLSGGEVAFKLGDYDRGRELVIDPTVGPSAYYSTYVGSGNWEYFTSLAVDPAGEAFISGYTYATNYPIGGEPGYPPYGSTYPSNYAANSAPVGFVTALNASGTGIIYSTYIGGNGASSNSGVNLNAIAVNASGNAFVGGQTDDTTFPTYKAFQATYPTSRLAAYGYTNQAAVVLELTPHGDNLVYSSFLGGGDTDSVTAIAVDGSNNAYVTGTNQVGYWYQNPFYTSAFPVTAGVVWGRYAQGNIGAGFVSAFATKIAPPSGGNASIAYSTVIGVVDTGSGNGSNWPLTYGKSIAVDGSGNAYVAGTTNCDIGANHSGIAKTLKMTNVSLGWSGCYNSYVYQTWVVELNPTATAAPYLAYLGGSAPVYYASWGTPPPQTAPSTSVAGIAVDSTGQVYVAGTTQANNLQTTSGAYQTTKKFAGVANSSGYPQADGFVTLIAPSGASFAYSTFLNGSTLSPGAAAASKDGSPSITGIALGTGGQFTVAGVTSTTDFPMSGSPAGTPLLSAYPGCPGSCATSAAFVTKFTTTGLVYSTLLGAGGESAANGIASNGTDIYAMFKGSAAGLTTGGAYDSDNVSGQKELVVRLQDAQALSTNVTVDAKTATPSSSDQTVSLTSSITSSSTVNGGTVTYTVTDSSSVEVGASVISGIVSGNVAPGASFTLPANTPAGSYTIHASYKGAQGFLNSTGIGNLSVEPPKANSTTVLSVTPAGSFVYGQPLTLTATVSPQSGGGTPTGTVTFYLNGNPYGTKGTLDATGVATLSVSAGSPPMNTFTASYDGDASFYGSTSAAVNQSVSEATTTIALNSSTNPSVFGQAVTFDATVSVTAPGDGKPSGTVIFLDGGNQIGAGTLNNGVASITTSSLVIGGHTITASYAGNLNFNGSTGSLSGNPHVVNKADTTTTVISAVNPSVSGQSVTFIAAVSPTAPGSGFPTGDVTFLDGGNAIGTGTLSSGVATLTTSTLAVANHTITTTYGGDGNFNGSTGALMGNPQVVNRAATLTIPVPGAPSVYGQSVTLSANVILTPPGTGTPTGTVTFFDGANAIGSGSLSGTTASFTTSSLPVGTHFITATYNGDTNSAGSTSPQFPQTVNPATTTTAITSGLNPSSFGQSVTFTATVAPLPPGAGLPTGTVTFFDNGAQIGTGTLSSGVATFDASALTGGQHTIVARYDGDGNFGISVSGLLQTVTPIPPTVTWTAPAPISSDTPLSAAQLNATASVPGTFVYLPPAGTLMAAGTQILSGTFIPNDPMDYVPVEMTVPLTVTPGTVALGTSSSPEWVTVKFATGGTVASVDVLTQGAKQDFMETSGGTCHAGVSYNAGDSCSLMVLFVPRFAGQRLGAVVLKDAAGNALATSYISGIGQAPQVVLQSNSTPITLGSGFSLPYGVAVDAGGNVYVANSGAVKQIVAVDGTIPSNPSIVTLGGGFDGPVDVAVDGGGNVYVADQFHNAVKKIIAGTGAVVSLGSGFNQPTGVAVDRSGNVFVADTNNNAVKEIVAATGEVRTLAIGFSTPLHIAVDVNGNVFVADSGNDSVKQIVAVNGVVPDNPTINTVGSGFYRPKGVAVDAAGDVLVIDTTGYPLKEIIAVNGVVSASSKVITFPISGFHYPTAVALDGAGNIFVADTWNNAIKQLPIANVFPFLHFPATKVGVFSSTQDVTVQNVGNARLNISKVTADAGFSLADADTACATDGQLLDAGAICTLSIQFAPATAEYMSGHVNLTDNAFNQVPTYQTITMDGTATPGDTTTVVAADVNPQTYGNGVTFTATVTPGAATGTVTFTENGTPLGAPQPVSGGVATLTLSSLTAGTHNVEGTYSGDANYNGSTSAEMPQTINQATPVITWAAPANITYGTALSATQLNASTTIGGTWTYDPPSGTVLSATAHTLTVTFNPTDVTNYTTATASVTLNVDKATASVTPNTASKTYGTNDPALTGTLAGFVASDNVTATYTRTAGQTVAGGPYTISATLAPADVLGNYDITYNIANFTITRATASVMPNAASKTYGASDPTLTGTLSGFVAADNVVATYVRMPGETVAGGPYAISATLNPAGVLGNYNVTYNTAQFTIDKALASVTPNVASKAYGVSDPTLTGTLSGFVGSDNVTATYSRAAGETVAGGPYAISATLNPAGVLGNYTITYNTANFTINKATASVTPTAASKTYGTSDPTLTGTLAGFVAGDNVTATYTRAAGETVAGGPYTISATLAPAALLGNYDVVYGTALFTINKAPASATLQTSAPAVMLLSSVTLTANVSSPNGMPTGTASFMDGSTSLGSGAIDNTGTATLTLSTLTAGSHNLTVVFSGDSNFNGITSAAVSQTVQDFQLVAAGGSGTVLSATVLPGGAASYQLQVAPSTGTTFISAITLSLAGLPAGATYTITPPSIAAGSGSQTITVQVQTPKVAAGLRPRTTSLPLYVLGLLLPMLGLVHLGRPGAKRKKRVALVLCLLLFTGILSMSACGGKSGFLNQAPQTYSLQLNGTSGALQHSATLNLTIQ